MPSDAPSLPARAALLARTLVHLHPAQLAFRPLHVARTQLLAKVPALARAVAGSACAAAGPLVLSLEGSLPADLPGVAAELHHAEQALAGELVFVGHTVPLVPPATDFALPRAPKLVRYQLNYLGIVRSLALAARTDGFARREEAAHLACAHLREFVTRVPPGQGDAWEPYPVAMRILHLVQARELLLPVAAPADRGFLDGGLLDALALHARWMAATLELHLLGNHLFTDGVALFVAGCALEAPGNTLWRALGRRVIARSLKTDVLADGGHSERSPMYQAIYLDQLLFALAAARARGERLTDDALLKAQDLAAQLVAIAHPDGEIPLFGDSAFDEAPGPADLAGALGSGEDTLRRRLYGQLAEGLLVPPSPAIFAETGLTAVRAPGELLVVDAGPLGPEDQPGHAHADALTFELSLGGKRLVTDTGAGHYADDALRAYARGPFAHSSVSVDGQGSDEVWSSFRAGRRARVEPLAHSLVGGLHVLQGRVRSAWGWTHERVLFFAPGLLLGVFDRVIDAPAGARVESHLHFAPGVGVLLGEASAQVAFGEERLQLARLSGRGWALHEGEQAPPRGLTAFRMGQWQPSPEVSVEAERGEGAHLAATALLLSGEAAATREGETVVLRAGADRVKVWPRAQTVRWERL